MTIPIPEKRRPLTQLQRAAMFDAHRGICCICGCKIFAGQKWIDEHITALGLLGSNDMANRAPAHVACAKAKTRNDLGAIAKAKRVRAKHVAGRKEPVMAGSRNSKFKRTIRKGTVLR